ncbi:hypothetical protein GCM10020331_036450 [Ectobacillus funiculus]
MKRVRVGVIGCGNISSAYFYGDSKNFQFLELVACADVDMERAVARAEEFHIPEVCTVEALLTHPGIDIVVNLTIPQAHANVSIAALEAGKHVYVEKNRWL